MSGPRWRTAACIALVALGALAPEAEAQRDHAVGVYFDPGATARWRRAAPLAAFDVFVITFNLDLPTKRAEVLGGFEVAIGIDPRLIVLDRSPLPYLAVESLDRDGATNDNWIVESSECLPGQGTIRLVRYVVLLAALVDDVILCLEAPTDESGPLPGPAWLDCGGARHPLTYVRDLAPGLTRGCGVVNPRQTVSTSAATWGAWKARYATVPR